MSTALIHRGGAEARSVEIAQPGASEARTLSDLHEGAQNGMRRVIAVGLFAHEIKSRLKHGQFGQWLAEHAPHLSREIDGRALPSKTLSGYMQLTTGVLESCGVKLGTFIEMAKITQGDLSHGGEILLVKDGQVPEEARPLRDKICALIDGKTQRQLFAEFKTADDDGEVAKAGGAKPIKFHCEKCAVKLTGIFGRKVTCEKCGTKQTAKPDPKSPEQQLKEMREELDSMFEAFLTAGRIFLTAVTEDELASLAATRKHAQRTLDIGTELTGWARARLKKGAKK